MEDILIPGDDSEAHKTGYETVIVLFPTTFYTLITVFLETYFKLEKNVCFFFELIMIVLPLVLGLTFLADYNILQLFFLFSISLLLVTWIMKNIPETKYDNTFHTDFITNHRATINILSVIAILAVDFNIFPSKFGKTHTYGYSVMDTGVGLYVFANGIVSPEARGLKNPISRSIKGSIILLIIGVGRFLIVTTVHYHVPPSEYGIHWNFFITLGVIKLFTSFFLNVVNIKYIYLNAIVLLLAHEILLQCGLQDFVFDEFPRDNFIKANKEGLVSSIGFIDLYLFAVYFGYILNFKKQHQPVHKVTKKYVITTVISLIASLVFQQLFGISRRIANASYVCWMIFLGVFSQSTFYYLQVIQKSIFPENVIYVPYIFEAVNYNGLVFFLLANVLTGIVNTAVDTRKVDDISAFFIVFWYMIANCLGVSYLFAKGIKMKL